MRSLLKDNYTQSAGAHMCSLVKVSSATKPCFSVFSCLEMKEIFWRISAWGRKRNCWRQIRLKVEQMDRGVVAPNEKLREIREVHLHYASKQSASLQQKKTVFISCFLTISCNFPTHCCLKVLHMFPRVGSLKTHLWSFKLVLSSVWCRGGSRASPQVSRICGSLQG